MMALKHFLLKRHCPASLTPPPKQPCQLSRPRVEAPPFSRPHPCPPANLGCAGFLLRQLLQLRPLLPEGVQHLLVADHLPEVPLVACIGEWELLSHRLWGPRGFKFTLPQPRNQFSAAGPGGHKVPEMSGWNHSHAHSEKPPTPIAVLVPAQAPPHHPWRNSYTHSGIRGQQHPQGQPDLVCPTQPFPGFLTAPRRALSGALVQLCRQARPPLPPPTPPCSTDRQRACTL